jgi:hypothetical protein
MTQSTELARHRPDRAGAAEPTSIRGAAPVTRPATGSRRRTPRTPGCTSRPRSETT